MTIKALKQKNKIIYYYFIILVVAFCTICFGLFQIDYKNNDDYSDFSNNWYSDGEEVDVSDIYKYDEISKVLPEVEKDIEIYMNVKSINIDVYIDDECIYKYEDYNKGLFGKTPGSYFIELNINREHSGKELTLKMDNAYNDDTGKIIEMYIGESSDVILEFVRDHLGGILISAIIITVGIVLLTIYIILKVHNMKSTRVLYLGLFALIIGIFMFTDSKFLQFINGDEYLYHMISETCMLLIVVPLMLFIGRAYKNTCNQTIIKVLCSLGLLNFVICYMMNILNIKDFHESLVITHAIYLLCIIYIVYLSLKSLIEKRYKEIYHTIGLLGICLGCLIDVIVLNFSSIVETSFFTRIGVLAFLCLEGIQFYSDFLKLYRQQDRIALLKKLAYEDGLTELLNRTSFMKDMEELKNHQNGLIAVFDVNGLKEVNDTYGHMEGDNLIIATSELINECMSPLGKCY